MNSDASGTAILLVEDDPLLATTVRKTLERLPQACSVHTCDSATEAERCWEHFDPEIVLMDYRLPDGYGTDVIQTMRRKGFQTRVVCMTAESEIIDQDRQTALAIHNIMQKPVQAKQLQNTLHALLKPQPSPGRPPSPRRIGRFRRIRLRDTLSAKDTARLVRAARKEKWIVLQATTHTKADETAMRSLCAWAGWLSAQGGRLCILAQDMQVKKQFDAAVGAFVDLYDDPSELQQQGQRLTGHAERRQLLRVLQEPDRQEGW